MRTEDLLRVGGRNGKINLPYENWHPIILPAKHPFTKLMNLTWRCLNGCAPSYLSSLVHRRNSSGRTLRSSSFISMDPCISIHLLLMISLLLLYTSNHTANELSLITPHLCGIAYQSPSAPVIPSKDFVQHSRPIYSV